MRKVSPSLERHIVNWTLPRELYPPTSRCFQLWQTRYTRHRIFSEHCFRGGGGEGAVERAISIFLLETLLSSSFFLFPPPLYYPLSFIPSLDFRAIFTLFSIASFASPRVPLSGLSVWNDFLKQISRTGFVLFSNVIPVPRDRFGTKY